MGLCPIGQSQNFLDVNEQAPISLLLTPPQPREVEGQSQEGGISKYQFLMKFFERC